MYLLTNGKIVTEESILEGYDLLIENDIIKGIVKSGTTNIDEENIIDAHGGYISPGFVDIHSDYIENMASPRPTSVMGFDLSLMESEKVLINTGITTMFHSLSFYGLDLFEHKPIRSSGNVSKLMEVIRNAHNEKHLIRHRFHARVEIDDIRDVENIRSYIKDGKVNLLSFMDHTPGQGQYRNIELYKKVLKGYKDVSDEEIDKMIDVRQNKESMTVETIQELADLAKEYINSIS